MKGTTHATVADLRSTFVKLLVLMVLTIAAGQLPYAWSALEWMQDKSLLTNAIALGIAVAKMLLVIQIFMGFKFSTPLTKTFAALGFLWFTLMFVMFADYLTRSWEPVASWSQTPPNALPRYPEREERGAQTEAPPPVAR